MGQTLWCIGLQLPLTAPISYYQSTWFKLRVLYFKQAPAIGSWRQQLIAELAESPPPISKTWMAFQCLGSIWPSPIGYHISESVDGIFLFYSAFQIINFKKLIFCKPSEFCFLSLQLWSWVFTEFSVKHKNFIPGHMNFSPDWIRRWLCQCTIEIVKG